MTERQISNFIDGTATPDERAEVERALAAKEPRVLEEIAWQQDLRGTLRDLAEEEAAAMPPIDLSAGIEARIQTLQQKGDSASPSEPGNVVPLPQPHRWGIGPRLLALAATIALALGIIFFMPRPRLAEQLVVRAPAEQTSDYLAWAHRVTERLGGKVIAPAAGGRIRVAVPEARLPELRRLVATLPPVFRGSGGDPLAEIPAGSADGARMADVEIRVEPVGR